MNIRKVLFFMLALLVMFSVSAYAATQSGLMLLSLDTIEEEEVSYVALTPCFDDPSQAVEDSGNLVIMRLLTDENGEEFFEEIDDDNEFDRVGNLFMSRLKELFDFEEEE